MRRLQMIGLFVALCGAGSALSGCASSSYSANESYQGGPVSTVAADPMGAAIFGGSGNTGNPDVANLDSK